MMKTSTAKQDQLRALRGARNVDAVKQGIDELKKKAEAPAEGQPEATAEAASPQEESNMRKTSKMTKSKARTPVRDRASTKSSGKTKVDQIADLLRRKNGCTTADVLKATGWPAVSMPQQAKAAGLKLRKERDGKVTRYYGT